MLSELPQLTVRTQLSGGQVEGHGSKGKMFSARGQGTECGHTCWLVLGLVKGDLTDSECPGLVPPPDKVAGPGTEGTQLLLTRERWLTGQHC